MSEAVTGIRRVLSHPWLYKLLQFGVGSDRSHRRFVAEHVPLRPDSRILDIGCGPAHVLRALPPDVAYVGFDASAEYIEAARREWGARAAFHCMDVRAADVSGAFDIVLVMGVLHHLDDAGCGSLFELAASALAPNGRAVVIEPTYTAGQSPVARWLIDRDRGEHVRTADSYVALARPWFGSVVSRTRGDLLRVPYTHAVLECADPVAVSVASPAR